MLLYLRSFSLSTGSQIVNDGSTDKTEQIVRGFEAQDSRVRVHTFETNRRWINLNQALADADLGETNPYHAQQLTELSHHS